MGGKGQGRLQDFGPGRSKSKGELVAYETLTGLNRLKSEREVQSYLHLHLYPYLYLFLVHNWRVVSSEHLASGT